MLHLADSGCKDKYTGSKANTRLMCYHQSSLLCVGGHEHALFRRSMHSWQRKESGQHPVSEVACLSSLTPFSMQLQQAMTPDQLTFLSLLFLMGASAVNPVTLTQASTVLSYASPLPSNTQVGTSRRACGLLNETAGQNRNECGGSIVPLDHILPKAWNS